ncbi:hypothetical protein Tco_1489009, partial [Tanacetum coccineum]
RWSLVNGIWEPFWAWRRNPSGRFEGDVSLITSLLKGLVLNPALDDKWIWSLEASGEFTVKSLSRAIQKKLLTSDVQNPCCAFCEVHLESTNHCFFSCPKIKILWLKIWDWWKAPGSFNPSLEDILKGIAGFSEYKRVSKSFHAVSMTVIWHVWTWRNKIIHAASIEEANSARHEDNFSTVQRLSLLWIFNRAPFRSHSWDSWVRQPYDLGVS